MFQILNLTNALFVLRKMNSWNSFSLLSHVWQQYGKVVNGNLIPVNIKQPLYQRKMFSFDKERKTLSFFSIHLFSQITISLSSKTIGSRNNYRSILWTIEAFRLNNFRYFFPSISFMFLSSS
jgi:hypothetical protein